MESAMERIKYALAQYMPDLLRQEAKNIGVFVADQDRVLARFVGEDAVGILTLGQIPTNLFNDVDLYLDLHEHWRTLIDSETGGSRLLDQEIIRNKGKAFSVIRGGEYEPNGDKSLEEITEHLFARMVASSSDLAGPSARSVDSSRGYLGRRLATEFRKLGILESAKESDSLFVRHPVRSRVPILGTNPLPHTPDFYQENGRRYVMEQVDFSVQTLARARDRAMYSQYMLHDIVSAAEPFQEGTLSTQPIAIVNRIKDSPIQDYALSAIATVPGIAIVYWDREEERRRFLEERRAVAEISGS
jgi:hypothetical protein